MKRRPYPLSLLMLGQWLLLCAVFVVFSHALATGDLGWEQILSRQSLPFWFVLIASAAGGGFAALGSRWLIVSASVSVAGCVFVTFKLDAWPHGLRPQLGACAWAAGCLQGLLLWPSSLAVLMDPSQRWWLQAKRRRLVCPVRLNAGDASLELESFDASETGVFLCMRSGAATPDHRELARIIERGDPVELLFDFSAMGGQGALVEAEISRLQLKAEGGYPPGVGLRFVTCDGPGYTHFRACLGGVPSPGLRG